MRGLFTNSPTSSRIDRTDDPATAIAPLRDKVFGVLVSAATFHQGRILLLRRGLHEKFMPGAWSIPAGKIQPGEKSLEDAALRELEEEAGISGKVLANIGMTWFESVYYRQPLRHIQHNFVIEAAGSDVELRDGSNMDHLWLPLDQADHPPVEIDDFTTGLMTKAIAYYRTHH
ncbi:NUDIX hydrolase [Thermomonospora cellulosilytica]|uniref:8-oxo-dGTP pyrophosphatase MutT (NUDIX family) n=1 Tax=Thermomonospora cellulosilytica TaxID=1411118 RepID=A0A7W3R9Q3_9ACTN|nr:NUDIX hydrolase [Thermomonospora cellulosilytica]MBA9004997.1 8-oxo-dGTP pyrophosphatase MutT (NUDIX family) [Thermomonospora cellulosilytica]